MDKGYKSLSDLEKDPDLTDMQKLGIKYVDDFKLMIPKAEAQGLEVSMNGGVLYTVIYPLVITDKCNLQHYVQGILKELSPAYTGIACGD